jgi:hypothetical protein
VIKRLPQFAEHHFASLCASAGVVCNASDQDECGWDFFLQYSAKRSPKRPADMQSAGPEALVQVKSTRGAPLVARIKLSNALRAAQATQPWFVVLIVPDAEAPRVYARHFWKAEIERTLRRVRLAEREGDTSFNRRHFDLRMEEADAHDDLVDWMRHTIESVKPSYAAEKARIVNFVGHEDGFGSMEITFEGTAEDLLNLQLGLKESLTISRGQYVSQRFGIEAPKPELELEGATLFIEPVGKPARLRLQGGNPTTEITVDAKLYGAQLPGADTTLHRWRVDAGPLRIVGGNGSYSANLTMRYEERRRLSDAKVFLTTATWRSAGPVGLMLFVDDKRIPLGALTIDDGSAHPEWSELRGWIDALDTVAKGSLCGEPEISIIDLCEAEPFLSRFANFVSSPSIRIEYEPEGTDDPTRAAVYYAACDVGEWSFLAVVERDTKADEMDGVRRSLTFGAPRLVDAIVRRGCWRDYRDEIEGAYRAQVQRLGKPETLWELGELEAFIKNPGAGA